MAKATLESASRRSVVKSAGAALAALAVPATALASPGDAELLELGRQFEADIPRWRALCERSERNRQRFREAMFRATGTWDIPGARYIEVDGRFVENGRARPYFEANDRISRNFDWGDPTEKEWDDLRERMQPLAEKILQVQPTTVAGLGVQARALAYLYSEWWDEGCPGVEPGPRTLVENVLRVAGLPAPAQRV
jgi:hypothetical protein